MWTIYGRGSCDSTSWERAFTQSQAITSQKYGWCFTPLNRTPWGTAPIGTKSFTTVAPIGTSRNVRCIQPSSFAFAAILENGSVVTWGEPMSGGDCSRVRQHLQDVQQAGAPGGSHKFSWEHVFPFAAGFWQTQTAMQRWRTASTAPCGKV